MLSVEGPHRALLHRYHTLHHPWLPDLPSPLYLTIVAESALTTCWWGDGRSTDTMVDASLLAPSRLGPIGLARVDRGAKGSEGGAKGGEGVVGGLRSRCYCSTQRRSARSPKNSPTQVANQRDKEGFRAATISKGPQ